MKIIFNAQMPNREVAEMVGNAVREYISTGIFPEDLDDIFSVELNMIDGEQVARIDFI